MYENNKYFFFHRSDIPLFLFRGKSNIESTTFKVNVEFIFMRKKANLNSITVKVVKFYSKTMFH